MDLPICSHSCEDCGRERGPRNAPNHTVEVKGEHCIPEGGKGREKDVMEEGEARGQEQKEDGGGGEQVRTFLCDPRS